MDLVCFGQQAWDHCWTGKQQLLTRLAARGHRVLYVDPDAHRRREPLREAVAGFVGRGRPRGLRDVGPGTLAVDTRGFVAGLGWRGNLARRRRALRRTLAQLGMEAPTVLVLRPDIPREWEGLAPRGLVYYAVDEWTAFGGVDLRQQRRIRAYEDDMLARADVALAVSPRLHERFARRARRAQLLPNGADIDHFCEASLARATPDPRLSGLEGPRLGFVGQVDERLDQALLTTLADVRRDWQIVLAGHVRRGVDVSRLRARDNVHLLGHVDYERLPSVMREFDVALLPYRRTALTESCCPLKVYEYAATGRPIVGTPLDGLGDAREVLEPAESVDAYMRVVERALLDPRRGRRHRTRFAAGHTWDVRVDALERVLDEARGSAGPRAPRGLAGGRTRRLWEPPERFHDYGRRPPELAVSSTRMRALAAVATLTGRAYHAARVATRLASGRSTPVVRRILVVRETQLGDLLVFLPALEALRRAFPEAHIAWGVQPGADVTCLLDGSGLVDEVLPLDALERPTARARLAGVAALWARGWDLVLTGTGYSMRGEALLCGAPRRIGLYDGHAFQSRLTRVLPLDRTRHETDAHRDLVDLAAGRPVPRDGRAWTLPWLDVVDAATGAPSVVVHVGSAKSSRRWPADRFAALIERITDGPAGVDVVLTGTGTDRAHVDAVVTRLGAPARSRVRDLCGRTDLRALVTHLDAAAAVVSGDTGVLHLARARRRPLVALLGPESHARWGPLRGDEGRVVALRHVVPCAPCALHECAEHLCMTGLAVENVAAALADVLDGRGPAYEVRLDRAPSALPSTDVAIDAHGEDTDAVRRRVAQADTPFVALHDAERPPPRRARRAAAIAIQREGRALATLSPDGAVVARRDELCARLASLDGAEPADRLLDRLAAWRPPARRVAPDGPAPAAPAGGDVADPPLVVLR